MRAWWTMAVWLWLTATWARASCPLQCFCPSLREALCHDTADDLPGLVAALGDEVAAILETLEATEGNTHKLRNGSLRAMPHLRRLVLDGNHIATIDEGTLADVPALQELSLKGNNIKEFTSGVISGVPALDRLFLSRNPLALPADAPLLRSTLRWLQLDNCSLRHLPDKLFLGVTNLRVLQLRDNALESLGKALLPLTHLSILALQGNHLVRQVFSLPPNLHLVNINDNDLNAIDKGMFDAAEHLEYLFVGNNYVSRVHEGSLLSLKKLKFLDLGGNKLNYTFKSISTEASIEIAHLEQLANLNIDGNEIETLNLEIFKKLKKLKELSLSRNKIRSITNEMLNTNAQWNNGDKDDNALILETLTLSENRIDFLGSSLRPYMQSLQYLNLSSNRLSSFSSSRLTQETRSSLKYLDLSYNRVNPTYAKTLELDYLSNLEYLSLRNNLIESIDENIFRRLKKLQYLDLSFNKFQTLPQYLFRNFKELLELQLNFINKEDGVYRWPQTLFDSLSNLVTLSMEGNNIRVIPENLFSALIRIENIDLSYNNLDFLNLEIFSFCESLKTVNLKHNRLQYFSCGFEKSCSIASIIHLDLEGNNFRNFDRNLSTIFPSLESLDLSKNLIEELEFDIITSFQNLSVLRASFNPVPCDCAVREAWQKYGGDGEGATRVEATCEAARERGARPWAQAAAALHCEDATSTALLGAIAVLAALVAANAAFGLLLLCGARSETHRCGTCCQGGDCGETSGMYGAESHANEGEWDDSDNEKNSRVERWRGQALYYGTDSEEDEEDPALSGLAFEYNAVRWAAARRANSRSTVNISTWL